MMDVPAKHLALLKQIFESELPEVSVWVFGSRANGKAKRYSDLDLVLHHDKPIDGLTLFHLKERLAESDLPFTVDLVEWTKMSQNFQKIIEKNHVPLF